MRILDIILEAGGGMYDRMQERRGGKPIVFKKGDQTLDLLDVQIFPQDPGVLSYKDMPATPVPNAPITPTTTTKKPATATQVAQQQPATQVAQQQPATQVAQQQAATQDLELNPEEEQLVENTLNPAAHTEFMLADILKWIRSQSAIIDYAKPPKPSDGAAIVVVLGDTEGNNKVACVHWTKTKKDAVPPIFWKTIEFERATGWIQGNAGKSATAKAAHLKMDPSDLLQHGQRYSVTDVPDMVEAGPLASREDLDPALKAGIPALLRDVLNNPTPVPVPGLEKYMREIEVVLGETAAPLALASGNRITGSYDDVVTHLLSKMEPPLSWADFTEVSYGQKGGELEDSELWAGDMKIMVSSKDSNGGAAASLKGFVETLDKHPDQFGPGTAFYKANKEELDIFRTIYDEQSYDGVLKVSRNLKFINQAEEDYIRSIYKKQTGNMDDIKMFPNLPTVLKAKGIIGTEVINSKGQKVKSKQGVDLNNPKYQFGYHLFGNLAVMIQKYFAEPARQNKITGIFKAVLNKADMVQVYTHTKNDANGAYFSNFKVSYPPTFAGKIIILADHYTSSAVAGKKISFKFDPTK
jgi:hypothetical protein